MTIPHTSVLLKETLQAFDQSPLHYFIDATLGAGGHSEAILKAHPEIKLLIGIDQDPVAREISKNRLAPWKERVQIIPGNFSDLKSILDHLGIQKINGILLDLGVSSMQFDMPEKGFSFMHDGPLDMRMDPTQPLTAAAIINEWPEEELARIFRDYGEEKRWRSAARAVVMARIERPFDTTFSLLNVLRQALPTIKKGMNPATLVFQALRIAVNNELQVLETVLPVAIDYLSPGGRLAVISFHSLEDRIVKNITRFAASDKFDTSGIGGVFLDKKPLVQMVTRKPMTPAEEEIQNNPRSRSAKLRVVEKL